MNSITQEWPPHPNSLMSRLRESTVWRLPAGRTSGLQDHGTNIYTTYGHLRWHRSQCHPGQRLRYTLCTHEDCNRGYPSRCTSGPNTPTNSSRKSLSATECWCFRRTSRTLPGYHWGRLWLPADKPIPARHRHWSFIWSRFWPPFATQCWFWGPPQGPT